MTNLVGVHQRNIHTKFEANPCSGSRKEVKNGILSPYPTGMETSWRPVRDSSLRGSRRHRRDVSWRFGGSRGSRGEIKHVRLFLRLFGDFFKSPVGLGDVAATSQGLNMFSRRKTFPRAMSPRRLRDLLETIWLRKSCDDVSPTSPQRRGNVSTTTIDLLL